MSIEVSYVYKKKDEVMYGLSNGENILDFRWPLKVKVKPWKLWSQVSQKRYEIERKCQWKLDRKSCMGFRMVKKFWSQVTSESQRSRSNPQKLRNTFIPVYSRYTHSKPTQKQWVVPCWLHWLVQCALCCYQTAKARSLCVYFTIVYNIIFGVDTTACFA